MKREPHILIDEHAPLVRQPSVRALRQGGSADLDDARAAVRCGIDTCVAVPFQDDVLAARIPSAARPERPATIA